MLSWVLMLAALYIKVDDRNCRLISIPDVAELLKCVSTPRRN